jgi:hypothetical protein
LDSVPPEFVSGEEDPALQKQRGKDSEEQTQRQRGEQTLKIYMLQTRVRRTTQLYHLQETEGKRERQKEGEGKRRERGMENKREIYINTLYTSRQES